jgi:acetolactate synthase I/II/III large subunit
MSERGSKLMARSNFVERVAVGEAAEGYLEALNAQGVDCLFLNPGTDTFPVQEAAAKLKALGRPAPRIVLCPFETVALAGAHGYYAATGRAQAVLVHVDVGTQNLGAMLHNAQRGRIGVVISAGRAPYTTNFGERGGRTDFIHWLQEQRDQHGIVRNYTKWDYEVRRPDQVGEVVARAFQLAQSDPPGPVYLTLPREVLMASPGEVPIFRPERTPATHLGAGDPEALREVARLLVQAERPLVITGATGRSRAGFDGLLRLADLLAMPVIEWRDRVNFPSDHPLHQGYGLASGPLVEAADLVLILDSDVPYIPGQVQFAPDATIIQVDIDPLKTQIPLWTFPLDRAITADSGKALAFLADEAASLLDASDRQRIEARRATLTERHAAERATTERTVRERSSDLPIAPEWLGACLGQLRAETPGLTFVEETVTNQVTMARYIGSTEPGSWFKSGSSGLGWGLGATLGVKLARPDQPVVALVGDGCFFFGAPFAAFWTAQTNVAPILAVILNNGCYNATKSPLLEAYPDGYAARSGDIPGVYLTPAPRYDKLADAVGAYGERVENPSEILPSLRRGLERVRAGQSAILDVILKPA